MDLSFISSLLELGASGILLAGLIYERRRSSTIQEQRIADLKEQISFLTRDRPDYPAQTIDPE